MIYGNIEGIRKSTLDQLEEIYSIKTLKDEICNVDILNIISKVSSLIEREISVGINRKGNVTSVAIGDSTSVEVPVINIEEKRLSGIRVIHTHPNAYCNLSALDLTALLKLKLDAIVSVAIRDGEIIDFSLGMLTLYNNKLEYEEKQNLSLEEITSINILDRIRHIENLIKINDVIEDSEEKAILVGSDTKESLEELKELTEACNIQVLKTVFQSRNKIDAAFYIGRGKVLEIASMRQIEHANVIIFDDELSGSQVRNLEAAIGAKVIDRTTLILEIFATRARTKEAKIQVELAQLKYRLNRLQGLGTVLSRTGGGIGTTSHQWTISFSSVNPFPSVKGSSSISGQGLRLGKLDVIYNSRQETYYPDYISFNTSSEFDDYVNGISVIRWPDSQKGSGIPTIYKINNYNSIPATTFSAECIAKEMLDFDKASSINFEKLDYFSHHSYPNFKSNFAKGAFLNAGLSVGDKVCLTIAPQLDTSTGDPHFENLASLIKMTCECTNIEDETETWTISIFIYGTLTCTTTIEKNVNDTVTFSSLMNTLTYKEASEWTKVAEVNLPSIMDIYLDSEKYSNMLVIYHSAIEDYEFVRIADIDYVMKEIIADNSSSSSSSSGS